MTEERWTEKMNILQQIVPAPEVRVPVMGPGNLTLPISKQEADRMISSVFEGEEFTVDVTLEDDEGVVLHFETITDPQAEPCSACDGSGVIIRKVGGKKKSRSRSITSLQTVDVSLFWYFLKARHETYLNRKAGKDKPWTTDELIQKFKFTNVFRELDAGTVWMREQLTKPHEDAPWEQMIGNCAAYRLFNLIATGEVLGWRPTWDAKEVAKILNERKAAGNTIFTDAHVVRSEFGRSKVDSVCDMVAQVYEAAPQIAQVARETQSLQAVFDELKKIHMVGGFIAYEIVTDLRHTPVLREAKDTMTWANLGPGAARGMARIKYNHNKGIESMQQLLTESKANLPEDFPALEMRDIEHSLCEFDKYCRAKFGEGKVRSYPGTA